MVKDWKVQVVIKFILPVGWRGDGGICVPHKKKQIQPKLQSLNPRAVSLDAPKRPPAPLSRATQIQWGGKGRPINARAHKHKPDQRKTYASDTQNTAPAGQPATEPHTPSRSMADANGSSRTHRSAPSETATRTDSSSPSLAASSDLRSAVYRYGDRLRLLGWDRVCWN